MKKLLPWLFSLLFFAASAQQQARKFKLPAGVTTADYLSDRVIVKLRQGSPASHMAEVAARLRNPAFKDVSGLQIKQLFRNSLSATVAPILRPSIDTVGVDRIYELAISGAAEIDVVLNALLEDPRVEYAEPSYIYKTSYVPNDPLFGTAQNYLSQIRAPQAWDLIRNSSSTVIAIVDSGSDLQHPDLRPNILLPGKDLVGATYTTMIEDNDPDVKSDSTDHGVRVSGLASAVSDNGIGIASVAFNAKLLIVKAGADNDASSIYRGYEGIKYAADQGAHIINCSWGGPGGGSFGQDIINYALSKGAIVITAAGNDDTDVPEYPAIYPGVMAVGSVDHLDRKSNFSNFGSHLAISAPGEVYTTANDGRYTLARGTSFSVPLVSSAAALVRSRFPAFDMEQVREQIRITADNIDAQNPGFAGLIGKGRLNVFRAVTETPPSIRYQKISLVDKGNGSIPPNDTLRIFFDIKNFLSPASSLVLTLSSDNPDVVIIDQQVTVGSLGTKETRQQIGPFRVFIKPTVSDNERVRFRLAYSAAGSYADAEHFEVGVSLDYINVEVNQIATTLTSNGRIGYQAREAVNGLGFMYKGEQLLFDASLMIGNAPDKVSNNARNGSNSADEHFIKRVRAHKSDAVQADFYGVSEFDDSGNPNRLDIRVVHSQTAFSQAPNDKYSIAEYEVKNMGPSALNGVYIGTFNDWDVDLNGRDITRYDSQNKMGYVTGRFGGTRVGAVKLLNLSATPLYYPLSYQLAGDPLQTGSFFSIAEKFETLSSGIESQSLGENSANGLDVMFVIGYGPFNIPANGSVKVAFAYIAGDDLADVQASAAAAQSKYLELKLTEVTVPEDGFLLRQNFPNPVRDETVVEFAVTELAPVTLNLYDPLGRRIRELINDNLPPGTYRISIPVSDLSAGVYVYKMTYKGKEKAVKMIVTK